MQDASLEHDLEDDLEGADTTDPLIPAPPENLERDALPMRLAKRLSLSTTLSNREARRASHRGQVLVRAPSQAAPEALGLGELVYPDDEVFVEGQRVEARAPTGAWVFHKPFGVVTTTHEPGGRPCLTPWLERLPPGTFAVGRLDRETTGLLLFTDDGDLAYMLLKPRFHVPKEYHLQTRGRVAADDPRLAALLAGVDLHDGPARALALRVCAYGPGWTHLRMVIDEGRNRQVRRMSRHVNLYLEHLHRARLGPLRLDGLPAGDVRSLTPDAYDDLWDAVGGRAAFALGVWRALWRRHLRLDAAGTPDARLGAFLEGLAAH